MNVNTFAAICIFTSAYSPLALIFTIKDYDFVNKKFNHPSSLITIWAITGLTLLLLYIVIKNIRGGHRVKIKDIEERSNELVNYTIPYMISFYGFDLGKYADILSFIAFMGLMGILTINTQSIFMNPILAIWKYGLYNVQFEENGRLKHGIILTKKELVIDESVEIQKISRFLYLVTR